MMGRSRRGRAKFDCEEVVLILDELVEERFDLRDVVAFEGRDFAESVEEFLG